MTYVFVGETLLGGLLRSTPIVKEVLKFLPGINGGAINANFPITIRDATATTQLVSAGRGVVTLVVYLVVFTVLSLLIFQRRDVGGS